MGSTAGGKGLALLRIDRVADALDAGASLSAGGLAIRLTDPNDVRIPPKQTVAWKSVIPSTTAMSIARAPA